MLPVHLLDPSGVEWMDHICLHPTQKPTFPVKKNFVSQQQNSNNYVKIYAKYSLERVDIANCSSKIDFFYLQKQILDKMYFIKCRHASAESVLICFWYVNINYLYYMNWPRNTTRSSNTEAHLITEPL